MCRTPAVKEGQDWKFSPKTGAKEARVSERQEKVKLKK